MSCNSDVIMSYSKLVLILILILIGNSTINLYASDTESIHTKNQVEAELSEDLKLLSPSHLSTSIEFSHYRSSNYSIIYRYLENASALSKLKAYYSKNRFIKPGLDLSAIIFPFHFFL